MDRTQTVLDDSVGPKTEMLNTSNVPIASNLDFDVWAREKVSGTVPKPLYVAPPDNPLRQLKLSRGQVVVIGGKPGDGKTALVQQMMFDALRQPGQTELRASVLNVEMSPSMLLDRELARLSKVPYSQIMNNSFPPEVHGCIEVVIETMRPTLGRVQFVKSPFTGDRLLDEVEEFDPDIVVVDYVQRLRCGSGSEIRLQTSEAMETIRAIAGEKRVVLAVAALNRASYTNSAPTSGDFRDSSELEYGADAAYVLVRNGSKAVLKCVKRRFGAMDDVVLKFEGDRQLFSKLEVESEQ